MTFCALPDLGPVPVNIVFSLNSGPAGGKPAVYGIGDGGHFLGMRIDLLNIVPVFSSSGGLGADLDARRWVYLFNGTCLSTNNLPSNMEFVFIPCLSMCGDASALG